MKKNVFFLALLMLFLCLLTACGCQHEWTDAGCLVPKTCALCQKTEGEPLGHNWIDATCESPKTCAVCAMTEGEALGHSWIGATCESPKTCTTCALTEGDALGHQWSVASCTEESACTVCGAAAGQLGPHMDIEAIDGSGKDVWFLCKCGQEEILSAEDLMLRLLEGTWTLRAVQKDTGIFRPDPENYWNESTWLEFPTADEPIGYEVGNADLAGEVVIPLDLRDFKLTTAIMYNNGPEIPVLSCTARSDYGENTYIDTPLILVIGDRDYVPSDYSDEDFIMSSLNGTVLSLWRFHADGVYVYCFGTE